MTSSALRAALAALLVLALGVTVAGAADPKPTYNGCGKYAKDAAGDATDPVSGETGAPDDADITGAWFDYAPAKGADATTVNIQVKNLTGSVTPPATSYTYDMTYGDGTTTKFVRAYLDFSGAVAYEYGHQDTTVPTTTRYLYDGPTKGALFTGESGVAQIVIPVDQGAKPGNPIKGATAEVQVGRSAVVPGAVTQAPTRGLSYSEDTAPLGTWTVGPCTGATAPAPGGSTGGTGGGTGGGAGGGGTTPSTTPGSTQQAGPAPITLVSKTIKHVKKGKSAAIKLKSTEALTKIVARISKGKSEIGRGKLAKLSGAGKVKVKAKKALKKGSYALDVVGTDAQGRQRIASFKLKVK